MQGFPNFVSSTAFCFMVCDSWLQNELYISILLGRNCLDYLSIKLSDFKISRYIKKKIETTFLCLQRSGWPGLFLSDWPPPVWNFSKALIQFEARIQVFVLGLSGSACVPALDAPGRRMRVPSFEYHICCPFFRLLNLVIASGEIPCA